ncbi:SCO family protein [Effusibacillus pohliae]|uniref:SCO family protein n=1 Tax=Effusibacillus pohliae TaxID=232270 RepID=UPI0003750862|nr:SCO family protein [Effusibacillus pohliae]
MHPFRISRYTRQRILLALAALVLGTGLAACGESASGDHHHAGTASGTPAGQATGELPAQGQIANFTLENSADKRPVSLDSDLKAKAKLVYFFYTNCPDVCPITTKRMADILGKLKQQGLDAEVKLISITVDPKRDTPEAIQQFAKKFDADPKTWVFLRGTKEQTDAVMQQFHVSAEETMSHEIMHNDRLFLLDEKNQMRASYVMSTGVKDEEVIRDIKQLLGK